jgi:glycosyltransferase involved in cell wall biosynthesis
VAALAACLERMVEDGALRDRIAGQGRAFITSRFDWDRATARLEDIIRAGR